MVCDKMTDSQGKSPQPQLRTEISLALVVSCTSPCLGRNNIWFGYDSAIDELAYLL